MQNKNSASSFGSKSLPENAFFGAVHRRSGRTLVLPDEVRRVGQRSEDAVLGRRMRVRQDLVQERADPHVLTPNLKKRFVIIIIIVVVVVIIVHESVQKYWGAGVWVRVKKHFRLAGEDKNSQKLVTKLLFSSKFWNRSFFSL